MKRIISIFLAFVIAATMTLPAAAVSHGAAADSDIAPVGYWEDEVTIEPGSPGDVDYDGEITILDANTLQRRFADLSVDTFYESAADYDGDGSVSILDATAIQRRLLNNPREYSDAPIEAQIYSSVFLTGPTNNQPETVVEIGDELTLNVYLTLPDGYKLCASDIQTSYNTLGFRSQLDCMYDYTSDDIASLLMPNVSGSVMAGIKSNVGWDWNKVASVNYTDPVGKALPAGSVLMHTKFKVVNYGNTGIVLYIPRLAVTDPNGNRITIMNKNKKVGSVDYTLTASLTVNEQDPTEPEPATDAPTEAPTAAPAQEPAKYYLIGSFNDWKVNESFRLVPRDAEDGKEQYAIEVDLVRNVEFKVVQFTDNWDTIWYPQYGGNYTITESGRYRIYFRPNYDGYDGWYEDCIYAKQLTPQSTETPTAAPTEAPTAAPAQEPGRYYLIGSFNGWDYYDASYPLIRRESEDGGEEYVIEIDLNANDSFDIIKRISEDEEWYYPDEVTDYFVTQSGRYRIYFRPNYDGYDGWYEDCIYAKQLTPQSTEPPTAAPTELPVNYYLVGLMTNWRPDNAYKFEPLPGGDEGGEEYKIVVTLNAGDQFKGAMSSDGVTIRDTDWYPSGLNNNYTVTKAGTYAIYLRPHYDGGSDWYYSCLYVEDVTPPATEPSIDDPSEGPAVPRDGYYLMGKIKGETKDAPDEQFALIRNTAAPGEEYYITTDLFTGDSIKIAEVRDGVVVAEYDDEYECGKNITANGSYTIYYRPGDDVPGGIGNIDIISASDDCAHTFTVSTVPPSCTREGYSEYHCTKCGYTRYDCCVPATGHTEGEWETIQPATSKEMGVRVQKCTVCSEELHREYIPQINRKPTLSGTLVTREISSPEEIKALGIDINDPENSVITECKAKLTYSAVGENHPPEGDNKSITYYTNGSGAIVCLGTCVGYSWCFPSSSSGGSGGSGGSGYTGGSAWMYDEDNNCAIYPLGSNGDDDDPAYYYLCMEGYGSILKQVFSVSLIVQNDSDELWYEDTEAEIHLHDGLSLATMTGDAHNEAVKLINEDDPSIEDGFIDKEGKGSATWYVRGDNAGSYDITVTVAGKIYPEPYQEFDDVQFRTEEPIVIEDASDCIELILSNVPETVEQGQTVNIGLTLKNTSERILNGIVLEIKGGERETLDCLLPDEYLTVVINVTFKFATIDADEIKYYLVDKILICDNNFPTDIETVAFQNGAFDYQLSAYEESGFVNEITDLKYACGSFSWDKKNTDGYEGADDLYLLHKTSYDKMYLKLRVNLSNQSEFSPTEAKDVRVTLTAPEGFSFDPFTMITSKTIVIDRITKSEPYENTQDILLYPVYLSTLQSTLSTQVEISSEYFKPMSRSSVMFRVEQLDSHREISLRNSFTKQGVKTWRYYLDLKLDGFHSDSSNYNKDLAKLGAAFSAAAYKIPTMISSFQNLGFSNIKLYNYNNEDDQISMAQDFVACAFATKKYIDNDKIYTVIAVVIRGTLGEEWYSNFDVGNGTFHNGFYNGYRLVSASMNNYYTKLQDVSSIDINNNKVFITGHSRAGAVSDILATEINSVIDTANGNNNEDTGLDISSKQRYASTTDSVYAYTFAAPNTTKKPIAYENVFNNISKTDLVPHVPGVYRRSGHDIIYANPHKRNYWINQGRMVQTFKEMFAYQVEDIELEYRVYNPDLMASAYEWLNDRDMCWSNMTIAEAAEYLQSDALPSVLASVGDTIPLTYVLMHVLDQIGVMDKPRAIGWQLFLEAFLLYLRGDMPNDTTLGYAFVKRIIIKDGYDANADDGYENGYDPGAIIYSNHSMETYIAWLYTELAMPRKFQRIYAAHCPVDLEVYDSQNKLVCKVVNNEVVLEDGCYCVVDGESKYFFVDNDSYTVNITGNDDGEMSITMYEYADDDTVTRYLSYSDLVVENGRTHVFSIGAMPEEPTPEDTTFYGLMLFGEEPVTPDADLTGGEITYVTVEAETVNRGVVFGTGEYITGQRVTLTATPLLSEFEGWYLDGELLSTELTYSFVCESDISLEARFRNDPVYTVTGSANWLDGWDAQIDSNVMTLNADGLYEITIPDVPATPEGERYELMIARFTDKEEKTLIGPDGSAQPYQFCLSAAGSVTVTYSEATGEITVTGPTVTEAPRYLGDVDGDGAVTIIDATFIQRDLAGLPNTSYHEDAADADEDGDIMILDATFIQRWLAGLPSNDNIGKPINSGNKA